jgi:hypothetical protein
LTSAVDAVHIRRRRPPSAARLRGCTSPQIWGNRLTASDLRLRSGMDGMTAAQASQRLGSTPNTAADTSGRCTPETRSERPDRSCGGSSASLAPRTTRVERARAPPVRGSAGCAAGNCRHSPTRQPRTPATGSPSRRTCRCGRTPRQGPAGHRFATPGAAPLSTATAARSARLNRENVCEAGIPAQEGSPAQSDEFGALSC